MGSLPPSMPPPRPLPPRATSNGRSIARIDTNATTAASKFASGSVPATSRGRKAIVTARRSSPRRLCDAAKGGQILCDDLVRGLARGHTELSFVLVGDTDLRGFPEPVITFEVPWTATVMELRLLGRLEVLVEGLPIALAGAKQRSVLAMLALDAGEVVPTDRLLDQIWGDAADGARRSLQVYVSNLRKLLADAAEIESVTDGYVLELRPEQLDFRRFTELAREGRAALARGELKRARECLGEALDLWRGPALADFTYETFARAHIERFEQERLAVLEDRIEIDLAVGRHAEVVRELGDLVADNPLREHVRSQLMVALYRCNRQADALNTYNEGRRLLRDELGVDPSRELQQLERAILDHDPTLDAPPTSTIGTPNDNTPEPLLSESPGSSSNLPAQLTSFIGREHELDEIGELLTASRLVTLTGPGGVGKTRLAHELATERSDSFHDGVWFVELAPLADPELVASKVASVFGIAEDAGRPILETLVDGLRDRETFVVFDNCEHVIDSAAKVVETLLRSCPSVQILATSREPLKVSPEQAYRVPSLGLPDQGEKQLQPIAASEAVRLFAERAAQQKAGFRLDATNAEAIARVCRRLDGIAFAIELTAARVGSLSLPTSSPASTSGSAS